MKVSKSQSEQNRAQIVRTAAQCVRTQGFDATTVAELAREAGLTHGALYSHFRAKEAMLAEGLGAAFDQTRADFAGFSFPELVRTYLSAGHRDAPGQGCPMAALASEVPRQDPAVQAEFARGFERFLSLIQTARGDLEPDQAMVTLAALVGAATLSRALKATDPEASDAVRKRVAAALLAGRGIAAAE